MSLMLNYLDKLESKRKAKGSKQGKGYFDASKEKARIESMSEEWLKIERKL